MAPGMAVEDASDRLKLKPKKDNENKVTAEELRRLPHDVELDEGVLGSLRAADTEPTSAMVTGSNAATGPRVRRLVTVVEVDDDAHRDHISVSARQFVEFGDGRRRLLLAGRGWGESGPPDIWAFETEEGMRQLARVVTGPDEKFGDRSEQDMSDMHWREQQDRAHQLGVALTADELRRLPHDVELSPSVLQFLHAAR